MEKLLGSWEKLTLSESEGNKFVVQDEQGVGEFLLARNFIPREF